MRNVRVAEAIDKRIVLGFEDENFSDPFLPQYISDGSLKMFAYLLLINHPQPRPLLAIEEPENYIHPNLHRLLADELRVYAKKAGQVFVSTHSPDFVNALETEELFIIEKQDGFAHVVRVLDNALVKRLHEAGEQLGYLWRQRYLDTKPVA